MLNAFYDFAVSSAKYDFVGFLLEAERYRQMTGKDGIRFIFVPGPNDGFREDSLPPSPEIRYKMMVNILFPMCEMLGVSHEVLLCPDRDIALDVQLCVDSGGFESREILPVDYKVTNPSSLYGMQTITRAFRRHFYPLRAAHPIAKQSDLITITLRECHYWPTRNSRREVWFKAAQIIKDAGFRVLFIPDTDSLPIEGWACDTEAATNLHRRAAIYESAAHNFFVSNGPAWMAAAMSGVSGSIFKMVADGAPTCSSKFYKNIGFPEGSQIGRDNFKLVWQDDTEDHVLSEVRRVIGCLQ